MAGAGLRSEKRAQAAPEPSSTPTPSTVHSSLAVQPCGGSSIPSTTQPGPKLGLHGKSPAMRYRSFAFQWAPCRSAVNGAPELSRKSGSQCAFRTARPRRRPNSGIIPPTVSTSAWTSSLARSTALRPMYSTRLALAVFMEILRGAGAPEDDSHLHDTSFESACCSRLGRIGSSLARVALLPVAAGESLPLLGRGDSGTPFHNVPLVQAEAWLASHRSPRAGVLVRPIRPADPACGRVRGTAATDRPCGLRSPPPHARPP